MACNYEDHPVIVALRAEEQQELERQDIEKVKSSIRAARRTTTYKLLKRMSNIWRKYYG